MKIVHSIIASLIACISIIACSEIEQNEGVKTDLSSLGLTKAHEEIANGQIEFSFDFFRSVVSDNISENNVISPFSMSVDLAMLTVGAGGGTYAQLSEALGCKGHSDEQLGEYYSAIIKNASSGQYGVYKIANAIWMNTEYASSVRESYKNSLIKYFDSEATVIYPLEAEKTINEWCSRKTDGMVKESLSSMSPGWRMVLSNAICFDGKWQQPYQVNKKTFKAIDGKKTERDFFTGKQNVGAFEYNTDGSKQNDPTVLILPYQGLNFKMVIVVPPAKETNFDKFVSSLSVDKYGLLLSKASGKYDPEHWFSYYIPKFNIEQSIETATIEKTLGNMGVSTIFNSDAANFGKISDEQLFVSHISQKTFIEVNEKGTRASAASSIEASTTSASDLKPEYEFIVDRPFVYILTDKFNNIHFIGTVVK